MSVYFIIMDGIIINGNSEMHTFLNCMWSKYTVRSYKHTHNTTYIMNAERFVMSRLYSTSK